MKVLCIGDSLCLPRDGVKYEQTWIYKLKRRYASLDFICLFQRMLTTNCLKEQGNLTKGDLSTYYNPDFVILQLGICDCAPRYINDQKPFIKGFLQFMSLIGMNTFFWKVIKTIRKRKPECVYVKPQVFRKNLLNYINILENINTKCCIIIKICTPSRSVQIKSPYLLQNVCEYNAIIDEIQENFPDFVKVVNPLHNGDEMLYVDGYHTNEAGAELVFNSISEVFSKYGIL